MAASSTLLAASGEGGQPEDDPGGAETTLAGAGGDERVRPTAADVRVEPVDGRHLPAGDSPERRHAGHPRRTVDPDGAATALALRTTAVLGRPAAEMLAQGVEQGRVVVRRLDGSPVEAERDQLNEEPQPQVRVALGFVMWNPAPCSPSL